jgi:hypothetical protein
MFDLDKIDTVLDGVVIKHKSETEKIIDQERKEISLRVQMDQVIKSCKNTMIKEQLEYRRALGDYHWKDLIG